VFNQATRSSSAIAKKPFVQRAAKQPALPCHIVGKAEAPATRPFIISSATAKPKARQHLPSRYDRRKERERHLRFDKAVTFAYAMDWPITTTITISWTALQATGERNEGHCLGRDAWDRETYIRDELARLCRSQGLPFAALWGRDVGAHMGSHVHLSMFWPCHKLAQFVAVIERVSGSAAAYKNPMYSEIEVNGKIKCIYARSTCGGWQIDMNKRDKEGALELAGYLAGQHAKHPAPPAITGKAFGISKALGKAAQERAQPMLEAREAEYGWMRRASTGKP